MIQNFHRKFSDFATSTPLAARRASQRAIRMIARPEGPHKFAREQFLQEVGLRAYLYDNEFSTIQNISTL
ncbi:MAG: hypothetical protein CMF59_15200 [Leptospiraceae bacterium]|nr:hypothetical protein [Leptospiraceae bacterium]